MSFGKVETPAPERKPWNVNDLETSSNQQNIVLPYFAGVMKCPVDWVTDGHNWTSRNVDPGGSGKGGKGGSAGANSQKNWYVDIAGVTNFCPDDAPNDALLFVLVNGELASSGPLFRSPGQHYVSFSLTKFSQACRFYWGTKDQPIDDLVITSIAGELNPAFRNQGLFVARQWFTGSSPNVQSIVLGLVRGTKFFESRFEAGNNGVNPMGFAYEIITDPAVGFGLPDTRLFQDSFQATADALDAEAIALAPALTQAIQGRALFAQLAEYYDGWFRRSGDRIEAGFFSHGDIDVDALPALGSGDIIGEAQINPGNARDTINAVWVTYTNRDKFYKNDDTDRVLDYESYLKRGLHTDDRLQRLWILDGADAVKYAAVWARVHSKEKHTGTLSAMRDRIEALGLRAGDRFKSNEDSLGLSFVWRIMGGDSSSDRSGAIKFTLENERGIYPALFIPDPAPGPPGFTIVPTAIVNARIIELRGGLKTSSHIQIQVLWQRPSTFTLGARVHVSLDGGDYYLAYVQQHFCAYGKVAVAYSRSTEDLDVTVGVIVDLFGQDKNILKTMTDPERDDNRLLGWINNEIFSVGQVTALGSDRFKFFCRRKLYGTTKANHAVNDECYFIFRSWLEPIEHSSFAPSLTRYFKLQPYVMGSDLDLDDCVPIAYNFRTVPALADVFNLALTSNAYVDAQGVRHAVILAAWDYALDQDIVLFGVAYRRTSSIGLIYNAEQAKTFSLFAKGAVAGQERLLLGDTGTDEPASLVRLFNEDQAAWKDVVCIGAAGLERQQIIPAADPAPGLGLRLFVAGQNLWFELLCKGIVDQERLALSDVGTPGLGDDPERVDTALIAGDGVESLSTPSTPWTYVLIDVPDIEIPVTAGVSYEVKVRPIDSWGDAGDYCTPLTLIADQIDLFQIANLHIAENNPSDHDLRGVDCHLVWDLYSPAQGITIEGGPDGSSHGPYDPGLVNFEIKIYKDQLTLEEIEAGVYVPPGGGDPVPVVRVWRDVSDILSYNFSLHKNIASLGGPHHIFTAWVGGWDPANRAAAPKVFYVTKAELPVGSGVEMVAAIGAIDLAWINPPVEGLSHCVIHLNSSSGATVRQIASPGTTHHFSGLAPGSSYTFALQWFDLFGRFSDFLDTDWSPAVLGTGPGGGADVAPVTFDPNGGAIDNTTSIALADATAGAAIYWRRDATTPTIADDLYTAPIAVDPPGSEDPFDISARAYLDGVYGPSVTKNFLPFTPGGGGPPPDQPSAPYFTPPQGDYYTDPRDYLDTVLTSDNTGTFDIYYTLAVGISGFPSNPTHDGAGNPTGSTIRVGGPSAVIRIDDPTNGYCRIRALVFKPGAAYPDSIITAALFRIHHT